MPDGDNKVLAQKAKNDDDTFSVVLIDGTHFKDVDLSARLKAVAGELDQGGGVVWRAKDKSNYYIARYNPLEDNFRVYKVEAGKRTKFASAKIPGDKNWHACASRWSETRSLATLMEPSISKSRIPRFRRRVRSASGRRQTPSRTSTT